MNDPIYPVAVFKIYRGGKEAEVAKYFIGNTFARQMFGNTCRLCVFCTRKGVQESQGSSKKVIFLLKNRVFGLTAFAEYLLTRWHLGTTLPP